MLDRTAADCNWKVVKIERKIDDKRTYEERKYEEAEENKRETQQFIPTVTYRILVLIFLLRAVVVVLLGLRFVFLLPLLDATILLLNLRFLVTR